MPVAYAPMYDLSQAVGPHHTNRTLDVMLVQWFISSIYLSGWDTWKVFTSATGNPNGPVGIMPITGKWSKELDAWIRIFQRDANGGPFGPLFVDGVVNRAGTAWGNRRNHTHPRYTIQAMNEIIFRSNNARFWNLAEDSSLPGELKKELGTYRFSHDLYD